MSASLRICHVAAEFAPFAKTGGLADVLGALTDYEHGEGHDVRVFIPFYSSIDAQAHSLELTPVDALQNIPLALGAHQYRFSVLAARLPRVTVPIFLVHCPALYDRPGIYTAGIDEHLRFLLLTRAAFESCQRLKWEPNLFHFHDWHTSLGPLYLRAVYQSDGLFAATKTVLTIHNIGYQGVMSAALTEDIGPDSLHRRLDAEDLAAGRINPLKHGILYADAITTVSPTYAEEICTPQFGMGLDATLRTRRAALTGILNGIDTDEWNPARDRYLQHHFDARRLGGKEKTKQDLSKRLAINTPADAPLLGIVSRMAQQKGFELLFEPLPRLLATRPLGLAVLGSGEARYTDFFLTLAQQFPGRVAFYRGYSEELAHLIEAGADIFLMPSRYEPCGLNQMYSLRYGTVPIVRKTGGLADSVQHFDPATGIGTGVMFNDFDSPAMSWALATALDWYTDKTLWKRLMRNGMAQDFSWNKQGQKYLNLYGTLLRS